MRRTPEFDAFGPWIYEVTSADELPPLYREAGVDPGAYLLVLKVPRNIERRNADPDMHLYDHLIAVDEETLTVLARRGDTYDTVHVPLHRIAAVEDSVSLLDGRLTVRTVDGDCVVVPYNGSSGDPVRDLVRLVRRWYLPPAAPAATQAPAATEPAATAPAATAPAATEPDLGAEDAALLTEFRRTTDREPGLRLINVAGRQVVTPVSRLEKLYRKVWPLTLHASIAVADDREVQILHRRHWLSRTTADYSLARTVLPRARISAVEVSPHERYLHVHVVAVHAGATCLRFPVPAGPFTESVLALALGTLA